MRKLLIRARQAPAIVIAIVALVAAVAGVAIANPSAFTSGGAITKKKVKKISTNVVNSLAPGLSVKQANQLSMYAQVSSGGSFVGAHPGVGSVTKIGANGPYCFSGLARSPVGGQATVDYNDSPSVFAQFGLGRDISGLCPANTQAFVGTFRSVDPPLITAAGFFVEIY